MSLFGSKKKNKGGPVAETGAKVSKEGTASMPASSQGSSSKAQTIARPRITEKSGILSQGNTYTFEVAKSANKQSVAKVFQALYKVRPVKVAMINSPRKSVFIKGRRGSVAGVRKALVTLKKGDKIDFV